MTRKKKTIWAKDVYEVGYSHGMAAFSRAGRTQVSPSISERQDYGYAWSDFMSGWRQAAKEYSKL